jgi:hypothetical protein
MSEQGAPADLRDGQVPHDAVTVIQTYGGPMPDFGFGQELPTASFMVVDDGPLEAVEPSEGGYRGVYELSPGEAISVKKDIPKRFGTPNSSRWGHFLVVNIAGEGRVLKDRRASRKILDELGVSIQPQSEIP